MILITPVTINRIFFECRFRKKDPADMAISVPCLSCGKVTFHIGKLQKHFPAIIAGMKKLPVSMRYSVNHTGMPWIAAVGPESRLECMTVETAEQLITMAVALQIARIMPPGIKGCDMPYIVIDDVKIRKKELIKPRIERNYSYIQW